MLSITFFIIGAIIAGLLVAIVILANVVKVSVKVFLKNLNYCFPLIFIILWCLKFESEYRYVIMAVSSILYILAVWRINKNAKTGFALQSVLCILIGHIVASMVFAGNLYSYSAVGFKAGLIKLGITAGFALILALIIYALNDSEDREEIIQIGPFSEGFGGFLYELLFVLFSGIGTYLLFNLTLFDTIFRDGDRALTVVIRLIPSLLVCGLFTWLEEKDKPAGFTGNEKKTERFGKEAYTEENITLVKEVFELCEKLSGHEYAETTEKVEIGKLRGDFYYYYKTICDESLEKLAFFISNERNIKDKEKIEQIKNRLAELETLCDGHMPKEEKKTEVFQNNSTFFSGCTTLEALESAYRKLCQVYHPDSVSGDNDMFLKVKDEYETLKSDMEKHFSLQNS